MDWKQKLHDKNPTCYQLKVKVLIYFIFTSYMCLKYLSLYLLNQLVLKAQTSEHEKTVFNFLLIILYIFYIIMIHIWLLDGTRSRINTNLMKICPNMWFHMYNLHDIDEDNLFILFKLSILHQNYLPPLKIASPQLFLLISPKKK